MPLPLEGDAQSEVERCSTPESSTTYRTLVQVRGRRLEPPPIVRATLAANTILRADLCGCPCLLAAGRAIA